MDESKLKFRTYSLSTPISVLLILVAGVLLVAAPRGLALPGAGLLLSILYFLQKQKLEEIRMFKDLFVEFNGRYDRINDCLDSICRGGKLDAVRIGSRIIDYLNLCAEEVFFHKLGNIHPKAWETWKKGMQDRCRNPQMVNVVRKEPETGLYYGLEKIIDLSSLIDSPPSSAASTHRPGTGAQSEVMATGGRPAPGRQHVDHNDLPSVP